MKFSFSGWLGRPPKWATRPQPPKVGDVTWRLTRDEGVPQDPFQNVRPVRSSRNNSEDSLSGYVELSHLDQGERDQRERREAKGPCGQPSSTGNPVRGRGVIER